MARTASRSRVAQVAPASPPPSSASPVDFITLGEVARVLAVSRTTAHRLYRNGTLKGFRPSPKIIRIPRAELERHLKAATVAT